MADILFEIKDRVGTVTINRPNKRNAINRPMWVELRDTLLKWSHNDDIGCVVLTGAEDAFSAGGDVKDMVARLTETDHPPIDEQKKFIRHIMEASQLLHEMPKPTIAAINGAVAGAGLSLALACDMRLMVEDAKLTTAFANIALSGDFGGGWFLSKIVGTAKAREMYYMPLPMTGKEAAAAGVVNRAVPRDQFAPMLAMITQHLANGPSKTLGFMKRNFNLAETANLSDYMDQESMLMTLSFGLEDHREAAQAFVDKRTPKFKGR